MFECSMTAHNMRNGSNLREQLDGAIRQRLKRQLKQKARLPPANFKMLSFL